MRGSVFLAKLKMERKLEMGDPSPEISESYIKKSADCLRASKLLFNEALYENAIGEAYYSMYNSALALFFRCGIKCENHSATMLLLRELFQLEMLSSSLLYAKKERIDKQYYVADRTGTAAVKNSSYSLIKRAEIFILEARANIGRLTTTKIQEIQQALSNL